MRLWKAAAMLGAALAASTAMTAEARPLKLDTRRIARTVDAMVADGRTVGASVLVWQGGRERLFRAAGMADREAGRPFARDTLLQIYSMTKPVTGVALMQLWEQGRFRLDDPLAKYLPDFAGVQVYAGEDAAGKPILRAPSRPILVRDILRHTAGFIFHDAPGGLGRIAAAENPLSLDHTLAEFGQHLARVPLVDDPGAQWSYSAGVDVQALLVETLSGQPFADYVRQHIFTPLGMKETDWHPPREAKARLARIYDVRGGTLVPQDDARWLAQSFSSTKLTMGGSGLVSSVDDYLRFARMLLGRGQADGVRIIKPETLDVMTSDMLDPAVTKRSFLPEKGTLGFGVDFAVRKAPPQSPGENRGAVGEFFWDGAPTMLFWIDPTNDLLVIFATQKLPMDGTLHRDIRAAVYGADYSGR
ncbi:MAG: serine hydrolase domain-containing protein [Novosphingobium sp.]|uniref:serine hydrolase domain-containing protein n=1 Tax=Novosphingobium sp. TaxID=1874826 RepID=UPI0032B7274D